MASLAVAIRDDTAKSSEPAAKEARSVPRAFHPNADAIRFCTRQKKLNGFLYQFVSRNSGQCGAHHSLCNHCVPSLPSHGPHPCLKNGTSGYRLS